MVLLVVAVGSLARAESAAGDDGWRRTAQGWERLTESHVVERAPGVPPASRSKSGRSPFHPLILAAAQVSLVAAAYWRLPVKA